MKLLLALIALAACVSAAEFGMQADPLALQADANSPEIFLEMTEAVAARETAGGCRRTLATVKRCCSASRYCPLSAGVCCAGGKACCSAGTQCVRKVLLDGSFWYGCGKPLSSLVVQTTPQNVMTTINVVTPAPRPAPAATSTSAGAPAPTPTTAASTAKTESPAAVVTDATGAPLPDVPKELQEDVKTPQIDTAAVDAAVAAPITPKPAVGTANATAPANASAAPAAPVATPNATAAPSLPAPATSTCPSFSKCYTACCSNLVALPTGELVRTCSTQCQPCAGGALSVLSYSERVGLRRYVSKCEKRIVKLRKRLAKARTLTNRKVSRRLVRKVKSKLLKVRSAMKRKEQKFQSRLVRKRLVRVTRTIQKRGGWPRRVRRQRRRSSPRWVRFDASSL